MKEDLDNKMGIAMMIFLLSICVFALNASTGILVAWIGNYDWATMSFPAVGPRLLGSLWIVQGISWFSAAGAILSWIYMKRLERMKMEMKKKR